MKVVLPPPDGCCGSGCRWIRLGNEHKRRWLAEPTGSTFGRGGKLCSITTCPESAECGRPMEILARVDVEEVIKQFRSEHSADTLHEANTNSDAEMRLMRAEA